MLFTFEAFYSIMSLSGVETSRQPGSQKCAILTYVDVGVKAWDRFLAMQ